MIRRQHWSERAACRGKPTEWWFPSALEINRRHHPTAAEAAPRAVAICKACPVRDECLEHAMATKCSDGVFGGLSPQERNRLARKRRERKAA